jgi:hypothetical protein
MEVVCVWVVLARGIKVGTILCAIHRKTTESDYIKRLTGEEKEITSKTSPVSQ